MPITSSPSPFDEFARLQDQYNRWATEERTLRTMKENAESSLQHQQANLQNAIQAREVIQEAAVETQQNLQYHIESLVNEALRTIWGDTAYTFKANFVQRRNRVECDLRLVRDGEELDPLDAAGGGVCDVVSMALRMVYHGLGNIIPVMIYDEPLRHLSRSLQENAARMRNALCRHLGLQFIIITHSDEAILGADRVFRFTLHNGRTQVEVIQND